MLAIVPRTKKQRVALSSDPLFSVRRLATNSTIDDS
jgi:hypothetical protein